MAVVLSGERRMATWECTLSQVSLKMLGRPYAVKIGPGGLRATTEVTCINDRSNRPGSTLLGSTANYRAFHKKLLSRKWKRKIVPFSRKQFFMKRPVDITIAVIMINIAKNYF